MSEVTSLLGTIRQQSNKPLKIEGPTAIGGKAYVQGSKNAANKLVAVTVALPGKYEIHNFPMILDPLELVAIVELLGGMVSVNQSVVSVDTTNLQNKALPYSLTKSTTSAFGFAGALLGRFGSMQVGKPGGDQIGPRPVDLHLDGLRTLGAEIDESAEAVSGRLAEVPRGKHFRLKMPSTGAAVNFVLAVAASGGTASLENSPVDGDMDTMYQLMRAAGIGVEIDNGEVRIDATGFNISDRTSSFTCSPDRNDAFTWLCYGALSHDGLLIERLSMKDVEQALKVLRLLNVQVTRQSDDSLIVKAPPQDATIPDDTVIVAGLAREFHSDWAPLLEVVLTTLQGECRIVDTLFSNRVRQAELLQKMGASITISGGPPPEDVSLHFSTDPNDARYIIDVSGPARLNPITTEVGYDVRACAAMVMAASQAHGTSNLSSVQALHRGYENIIDRLSLIGVDVAGSA
jgi:UDP-N-acetylglucosamine 1-carboxyvinyltransferase